MYLYLNLINKFVKGFKVDLYFNVILSFNSCEIMLSEF